MRKNKALTYRANKYRARRTEYGGIWYSSKAEADRAAELDLLLKAGEIVDWIGQPTVRLGVPENVYRPDFLVIAMPNFSWEARQKAMMVLPHLAAWYEDIKGAETPKFRRDVRLWESYGRLPLRIIRNGKLDRTIEPKRK